MPYFDVVVSIYCEAEREEDYRVDSHLVRGGFKSEKEATDYVESPDFSAPTIPASADTYAVIEIEHHDDDGAIAFICAVDV